METDKRTVQCAACGAQQARSSANFCRVCGKNLKENYQPLDLLRSSYRLQRKKIVIDMPHKAQHISSFAPEENASGSFAWACFVYSLVPYLGMLFIPFTVAIAVISIRLALCSNNAESLRLSRFALFGSIVVLVVQIFLWWLLYFIPSIAV